MSGQFEVKVGAGQFTKLDPGMGKLLGVLSLQALPRRINLDFRDVFSEGFAFDSMTGKVAIANGILRTDDLTLAGPAAKVRLAGEVDLDRERVSLSLKATQEDPWQVFARTHAIGQVAPGKVTKLVPFGAFVRVADGIEGLVHISELSGKHVELAEQVVSVGEEVFVKVIDIDLDRRRISLSLKQANENVDPEGTEFDPALYGMATEYDDQGNYKYPDGFDPETNEWREGFESQREAWEQEYAAAQARWEAHKAQVAKSQEEAATVSEGVSVGGGFTNESTTGGTLADDESLAALREKLSSNN